MKAAPEKIYIHPDNDVMGEVLSQKVEGDIEYIRADLIRANEKEEQLMPRVIIEIDGKKHQLVKDDKSTSNCEKCSLSERCCDINTCLCIIFNRIDYHFEKRKVYEDTCIDRDGSPINTKRIDDHDIEYIKKDAFIEKALAYLNEKFYFNNLHYTVENNTFNCMEEMYEDFRKYMEEK